jgi:hypothetical protein
MNEDFYAVVKLVSGEELFGIVSPTNEYGIEYLIISDPIILTRIDLEDDLTAYDIEPWLKLTTDSIFFIEKSKIITVVESFDEDLIELYKQYLKHTELTRGTYTLDRTDGFLDNVKNFRYTLENLYNT